MRAPSWSRLTAAMMPLSGLRGRNFRTRSRNDIHSPRSSSSVAQRPAVSRRTASFVSHQSQLRVPPMPRTPPPDVDM
ncbi:MAG: hypothetical protein M5U28_28950 [Sandaracinaceae bacterium]|nr:hypothetical protein [Sandaracinaceae bacterium]